MENQADKLTETLEKQQDKYRNLQASMYNGKLYIKIKTMSNEFNFLIVYLFMFFIFHGFRSNTKSKLKISVRVATVHLL